MGEYRVIYKKQDLGVRINLLYKKKQLSVGILDTGSRDEFIESIRWYSENIKPDLYAMTTEERMDGGEIRNSFSNVNFIVFRGGVTTGEYINAFADTCSATYFLVVRSDTELISFDGKNLMEIMEKENHPAVITPVLLSSTGDLLPSLRAPFIRGRNVDPLVLFPDITTDEMQPNLYPVMEMGLYDRALFQRLRKFDTEILGEFYQAMDYGVRCHLLGYSICTVRLLALRFPDRISVVEDRSLCDGVNRFYTKAMSIRRIAGKNVVEKWKPYVDKNLLANEVKTKQKLLQKTDFQSLIRDWRLPETSNAEQGGSSGS